MLRLCGLLLGGCILLSVLREVGAEVGVPTGYSRSSWELLLLTEMRTKDRTPMTCHREPWEKGESQELVP